MDDALLDSMTERYGRLKYYPIYYFFILKNTQQ